MRKRTNANALNRQFLNWTTFNHDRKNTMVATLAGSFSRWNSVNIRMDDMGKYEFLSSRSAYECDDIFARCSHVIRLENSERT